MPIQSVDATVLRGQVAIVTGASRGLGREIARTVARAGALVSLVARSADALRSTADLIADDGSRAAMHVGDITDAQFMRRVVSRTESGLGPIDLLVNNAGELGPIGPFADADIDEWWRTVEVDVRGTALPTQLVLPRMCSRGRGRVINIVSGGGVRGHSYFSAYTAAKTAVIRLTEIVAAEVAPYGVRVFAVQPGTVKTDMSRRSVESVEGRRWIPWFARIFTLGADATAGQVANRVLEVATGRADALSGRYIPLGESVDDLVEHADDIADRRLYTLRVDTRRPATPSDLTRLNDEGERPSGTVIQLRKILRCTPDRAYRLWTDGDLVAAWVSPQPPFSWLDRPRAATNPGEELSLAVRTASHSYRISAVCVEASRPDRLAYRWSWRSTDERIGDCDGTELTVTFERCEEGTELLVRHEGLPTVEARDAFIQGWIRCFTGMEGVA